MTHSITHRLAPWATVGTVVVFAANLARHHPDPSTAAESGFLAWVAGFVLGALSLSRHSAFAVVPCGLLLTIGLCLPAADGTRGALALVLLVAAVAALTWKLLRRSSPLAPTDFAALAVAWQCLLRSSRFLGEGLEAESLVWLAVLPLTAAAAAWWFGRGRGSTEAVVLMAAVAIVTPGFGVVPVAVLVMVAALCGEGRRSWQSAAVASGAAIVAIGRLPEAAPALLVLAAALAWRDTKVGTWLPWSAALVWSLWVAIDQGPSIGAAGWLLLLLPVVVMAPERARPLALAALALALGYRGEAPAGSLAPAFALAALTLPPATGLSSGVRRLQIHWSLITLCFVAARASYPWLRPPMPHASASELLGTVVTTLGWPLLLASLAVAVAALAAAALGRKAPRWLVVPVLLALVLLAAGRPPSALTGDAILLTAQSSRWQAAAPGRVRELVVDSFLNRGESLRPGQPVAEVVVSGEGGLRRLTLRNGDETADWAARRLDLEQTPSPWLHWHGGDGTLAQNYRTVWRFGEPLAITRIDIVRSSQLPPDVAVAITTLEAR